MSVYVPKAILLPSGLDEIGLDRSMVRLPGESLIEYKRRLLLEHRDPVTNSFNSFKKSPTRQVGQPEIAVARLTLTADLERPRLKITSSKLYWYEDAEEDPTLELDIQHRDGAYFLEDVITELTALGVFSIEILDSAYQYRFSRNLRVDDTDVTDTKFLSENYVNRLDVSRIRDLTFTESLVFKTEKLSASLLEEDGDFYVDYENGVVFSNDLQRGYVSYTYSNFPFILWWQPVRVFELNDQDVDVLIKDNINVDAGMERKLLNWRGAAYVNELSEVHPLEWGS